MGVQNKDLQRGSLGGYILVILLIVGFLTIASRLVPIYLNHNTLINILDKMPYERGLEGKTDAQLMEFVNKRLRLNNLRDFPIYEHVELKRGKGRVTLVLDYEVRVPLIANLDVIASFNEEIQLSD